MSVRFIVRNRPTRVAMLACACALIGGCGWTARDQFYHNRALVLMPQDGDGSQITSTHPRPGTLVQDTPQVAHTQEGRDESMQ